MELMTKGILNNLRKHPAGSQDGKGENAKVIVKYFNPSGVGTWLITELEEEREDGDIILYGYCELGYDWEWGSVSLNELKRFRGPWGLGIERDLYCGNNCTVKGLAR